LKEGTKGAGISHSDQFMLDVTSPVVHRLLTRWINHSDCEAWVEQGSYYIEALRTLEETASTIEYAAEDNNLPCGRRYSAEAKVDTHEWLNRSICLEQNKTRQCTWSTPTSMACMATDFDGCVRDGTWRLKNISANNQPPPILFYPEMLWPTRTKGVGGTESKLNSTNNSDILGWLESQFLYYR